MVQDRARRTALGPRQYMLVLRMLPLGWEGEGFLQGKFDDIRCRPSQDNDCAIGGTVRTTSRLFSFRLRGQDNSARSRPVVSANSLWICLMTLAQIFRAV